MASFLENTRQHVARAASALELGADVLASLEKPREVHAFEVPMPLEDGSTKIFSAWRVQHNDALGPYKGGIRYHPASSMDEVSALASLMTWKTSLAGLPYGGAKGAITVDPKAMTPKELEAVSRSYVRRLSQVIGPDRDIPAPDVGTNAAVMAWMADEYGKLTGHYEPAAFTGKPVEIGGSEGREEATGFGGAAVLREYLKTAGGELPSVGLRIAIQGTGNVGGIIAEELMKAGHRIVALADSKGAIFREAGIDVPVVIAAKAASRGPLAEISGDAKIISNEELLALDVDVLIPAALENVITAENAERIQAKIILEMANGPVTPEADVILAGREVAVIPDILANSGGVIGSYLEWVQGRSRYYWEKDEVLAKVEKAIVESFRALAKIRADRGGTWRDAAYIRAVERVVVAMRLRGWA